MLAPPEDLGAEPTSALGRAIGDASLGWQAFANVSLIGQLLAVLALAVTLAGVIAYHPSTRAKATTLEQIEQPKTFMMYGLVAALVAIVVRVQPSMALVVFGIGGLMRFRTEVGEAKDTGRVILVTVVGLCCGLELYVVALLATTLAFVLIFALERRAIGRVTIQGLDKDQFDAAAEAHTKVLQALGYVVLGETKRVHKGTVTLIVRAPAAIDRGRIELEFTALPDNIRGTVNWELS